MCLLLLLFLLLGTVTNKIIFKNQSRPIWLILVIYMNMVAQTVKRLPTMWETQVQSLGWEDLLEKEMVTHSSSILAWKIPWTEKPGRLQAMGLQRVRHDWATSLSFSFQVHLTKRDEWDFSLVWILFKYFRKLPKTKVKQLKYTLLFLSYGLIGCFFGGGVVFACTFLNRYTFFM